MKQLSKKLLSEGISKRIGIGVFFITISLILFESIFFWRESLFYLDGNKVLFELYDQEWFSYMHNRFAMAITQVLPILFLKLDIGSPKFIFLIQSISFAFPPLIVAYIVTFIFKDYRSVVLILFFYVFGSIEIHYIKEWGAYAAVYLIILTASFLQNYFNSKNKWHWLVAFLLIFITINAHPLCICFFAIFFLLRYTNYSNVLKIGYLFSVGFSVLIAILINEYSGARVNEAFGHILFNPILIGYFKVKLIYYDILVLIITVIVALFVIRKIKLKYILVVGVLLSFLVLSFSFLAQYTPNFRTYFYFECQVFLILIALLYFSTYRISNIKLFYFGMLVIAIVRFFTLNYSPQNRVHQNIVSNEQLLVDLKNEHPEKNVFIINREKNLTRNDFPDLFIEYESFLMSSYMFGRGNEAVIYLTNYTGMHYNELGHPIFYNKLVEADQLEPEVDSFELVGEFDPVDVFPSMNISAATIQQID